MLRYSHSNMAELERALQKVPENSGALIVTDGVFSMGGDTYKEKAKSHRESLPSVEYQINVKSNIRMTDESYRQG